MIALLKNVNLLIFRNDGSQHEVCHGYNVGAFVGADEAEEIGSAIASHCSVFQFDFDFFHNVSFFSNWLILVLESIIFSPSLGH
jgi:di/tripeptidase